LLLSALAGEAILLSGISGSPQIGGDPDPEVGAGNWILPYRFAIVSQSPWMMEDTTIRGNILFGLPLDQERYRVALHSCALSDDLKLWRRAI